VTDARVTKYTAELDLIGPRVLAQLDGHVRTAFDRMSEKVRKKTARVLATVIGVQRPELGSIGVQVAIDQARDRNIRLVENAARAYAQNVRDIFEGPEAFGQRVEDLRAELLKRGDVSLSRADLIARDQTLKLNGQINEIRQRNAGIDRYEWSTSRDERVREEHEALEGRVFSWSDPPEPGHPGEDFQCRCVAIPVLDELD
jgi:SPP1 gp7 family putative phage head morphogenesis protein